jgi:cysteinyl-tRNA synthetase
MAFQVFDSLTREKRAFEPLEPGLVRMYNCGPTVYGRVHVGNLRTFLFADTLRRWLELSGYQVRQVMNITDVGHLLDDADEGEDKIEAQARREKRDPWEISRGFTELFLRDVRELGLLEPFVRPKASEHVPEMLEIIEGLLARGYAYQVGGDVYFEVAKFPRYGRLSGNTVAELEAGARIEVRGEKRQPADFALWKSDPKHLMKWESRFGPDGFPGWHIECSAMARKHLGDRSTSTPAARTTSSRTTSARSRRARPSPASPSRATGCTRSSCRSTAARCRSAWERLDARRREGARLRGARAALRADPRALPRAAQLHLGDPGGGEERAGEAGRARRGDVRAAARGERAAADARAGLAQLRLARERFDQGMDDDLNVPQALASLFELRAVLHESGCGAETAREALVFLAARRRGAGRVAARGSHARRAHAAADRRRAPRPARARTGRHRIASATRSRRWASCCRTHPRAWSGEGGK